MSKLKPQEIEQRKREIIEAARICFLRNGFHQTTTDEICREAAITPGGLYHYFGSKEEIISAVIEDAAHTTVQNLRSAAEASGDVRTAVQALASLFFQWIRDPQLDNVTRLDMEIWAESLRNEKLAGIARESRALRRRWLESLIRGAVDEGVYTKDVDPRGLANLIMSIFDGLRLGRLLWRDDFDVDGALKALVLMTTGRLTNGNHVELAPEAPAAGRS
ncbi:MAG: TetR/AcrR family transcriptional regulator [Dehalococcoidia bacterium]|nr:TetR/AcrR family transcriptional regulator [Dehalococcoidia bacterium]